MFKQSSANLCERCDGAPAHSYQLVEFGQHRESSEQREFTLCVRCARRERAKVREEANGVSRQELIAELDRFFAASGVFDICGRCHRQGTGCCPPTCRVMGAAGCDPHNKRGKTVFCAAFVCSALLNAISECDAEVGRELRWIKRELGPAEFRVYEMITRVPAAAREQLRPLALPQRYPRPIGLDGEKIRPALGELAEEVLRLRRQWREQEIGEEVGGITA